MKQHFKLLGHKVRDAVTGFEGVCESISFDLYGCIQAIVRAPLDKKDPSKRPEGHWFDAKRLKIMSKTPVMPQPTFDVVPGGIDKPPFPSQPAR